MLFLVLPAPLFTSCICSPEPWLSTDHCRQQSCIGTIVQVLLQLSEATAPQKSVRWNSIALKLSDKEKRPTQRALEALTAARLTPTECNRYAMFCCTACVEASYLTAPFRSRQPACTVAKRDADLKPAASWFFSRISPACRIATDTAGNARACLFFIQLWYADSRQSWARVTSLNMAICLW